MIYTDENLVKFLKKGSDGYKRIKTKIVTRDVKILPEVQSK